MDANMISKHRWVWTDQM